ncbi:MAG TPA: PorV/PorQ family protein [Candidatus Krumholzibacteria bacterium]
MRKLVLILALSALVPAAARAQNGGLVSPFSIGAGSRAISLGRAYSTLADDASAPYWNPAALKNVQQMQFMAMYLPSLTGGDYLGADYMYAGFVYPTLSAGAFGIGYTRVGSTFDRYDEQHRPEGEGNYNESQLLVSYAAERHVGWFFGTLAGGASFKISRQIIDPFSSNAPGVDVGLLYTPDSFRALKIGINVQDLAGGSYKLDTEEDTIDRTIMAGAGYTYGFENGSALRLMIQYDKPERADTRFHVGAEYAFSKMVSLRAGFDDGTPTFGLGVGYRNYGLDYAFQSKDEVGSSQAFTFNARFGSTLDERRAEIEAQRALDDQALIRRTFEARVAEVRKRAKQMEAAGDWSGALGQWQIVLEYLPDDAEAARSSAAAREQVLAAQAAQVRDVENQAVVRTRFAAGLDRFNENDLLAARTEWQAILAIDPQHEGARDYLAQTQKKIDERLAVHVVRANQLERDNRLTEAIAEWNNVQQYNPEDAQAAAAVKRLRGRIESVSQDYQVAQRKLRIVTLYNDALQMYNAGKYSDAMKNLSELLSLQPDHADAKKLQALAKRKTTPLTEAEKARIRELYLAGMQQFSQDQYAQAIAEWEKILAIDPTNSSVQRSIDEARERLRRVQERR